MSRRSETPANPKSRSASQTILFLAHAAGVGPFGESPKLPEGLIRHQRNQATLGNDLVDKLASDTSLAIATPTLLESGIVIESRLGIDAEALLDRFLTDFEVTRIPFGEHHWREALTAYCRFGRSRHPASLNFGDCIAYATAKLAGEPLLFVGDDFSQTDIEST